MVMSKPDATTTRANLEDAWGQPTASSVSPSRRQPAAPVPDDWDADDSEEEPDAKDLWEIANSRQPMPQIQLSTTSSSAGVQLPPLAALEAPRRILKRPASSNSKTTSSSCAQPQKSLKEREAQYQAARERIFGEQSSEQDNEDGYGTYGTGQSKTKATLDVAKSTIIRDPLGPASVVEEDARSGFRGRHKEGQRVETSTLAFDNNGGNGNSNTSETT